MQYSETLQQIERSETFDRLYILIVLIAVSVVLAVTLCLAVFRKKTPFKLPLVVFVILLCVIGAYIFQNVKISEVRADLEAQDYVTYVGDFEVRYFLAGEKATTVLIPGEEKEIQLTVVTLALKYLLSNVEEIDRTLYTGEYTGEVVYAPRSRYVIKLVIH